MFRIDKVPAVPMVLKITDSNLFNTVADPDPSDMVLGLLNPDPDPLVRSMDPDPDPDPSVIKQKK